MATIKEGVMDPCVCAELSYAAVAFGIEGQKQEVREEEFSSCVVAIDVSVAEIDFISQGHFEAGPGGIVFFAVDVCVGFKGCGDGLVVCDADAFKADLMAVVNQLFCLNDGIAQTEVASICVVMYGKDNYAPFWTADGFLVRTEFFFCLLCSPGYVCPSWDCIFCLS